jgi:hypothetical protein
MSERQLRKKYSFSAHGKRLVLIKRPYESEAHVLCKAAAFALYLPGYPRLLVEVKVGQRYKPDLVQLDRRGMPEFWGECGSVGKSKVEDLLRKFRGTKFAFLKCGGRNDQFVELVRNALEGLNRSAPVDMIFLPELREHVGTAGNVDISFEDCDMIRLNG